jgi:peptidoglycan lytic transglycosylase
MSGCCRRCAALALIAFAQSGCATADIADGEQAAEEVRVEKTEPPPQPKRSAADTDATPTKKTAAETGTATWYGPGLEGKTTASGERFTGDAMTAAHKTLPFGTRVRVTALDTLASVVVTINDRLPAASRHVIDLSQAAGRMLKMIGAGIARVRIEILE